VPLLNALLAQHSATISIRGAAIYSLAPLNHRPTHAFLCRAMLPVSPYRPLILQDPDTAAD